MYLGFVTQQPPSHLKVLEEVQVIKESRKQEVRTYCSPCHEPLRGWKTLRCVCVCEEGGGGGGGGEVVVVIKHNKADTQNIYLPRVITS